jgi:DNA-directed RNA polymerase subunit RPC12/RpoP
VDTPTTSVPLWLRISCRLWGHVVDNDVFRRSAGERRHCRCGVEYLAEDGRRTHVRHTVSCFLRHHTYVRLADRGGVHEYVCVRCGHPLVFPSGTDRFAGAAHFTKKVRYACGLFGHRVTAVAARQGFVEYACHCGHSFLKHAAGERKVRHPLRCFFQAHRIRFVTHREGYAEYVCDDCGHPFCFVVQSEARSLPIARGVGRFQRHSESFEGL